MVSTEGGFRTRATSLLQSASPFRSHNTTAESHSLPQTTFPPPESPSTAARAGFPGAAGRDASTSMSSAEKTLVFTGGDDAAENRQYRRFVRVTPAWANSPADDDGEDTASSCLLPQAPLDLQIAQHNNSPSAKNKKVEFGRLWDGYRESTPPTSRHHVSESGSRWRAFADTSGYPPATGEVMHETEDWLLENGPDYSQPWRPTPETDLEKKGERKFKAWRRILWRRTLHTVLRNPMVPLVLRTIVWSTSLIALALGIVVYRADKSNLEVQRHSASPIMAIVVDAVALIYIPYITNDEYRGKPLGLRSPRAKMRLIFLDLFFIVFDSANLGLAFEAITDFNLPPVCPLGRAVCGHQEALASVLLIALVAWMMTFSISVLRVVERVEQK